MVINGAQLRSAIGFTERQVHEIHECDRAAREKPVGDVKNMDRDGRRLMSNQYTLGTATPQPIGEEPGGFLSDP